MQMDVIMIAIKDMDFDETFNHLECCTFIKDTQHRYTFVNDAVCKLFGLSREKIIGKTDFDFFDLELDGELHQNDKIVLSGTPISLMEKNKLKNKTPRYYQVIKSPLFNKQGHIYGLLGFAIDISNSIVKSKQIEFLAMHDQLTGVFNRGYLELHLKKILSAHSRHQRNLSVMMIDIDNFKFINDNYGHTVGDNVLREIGALLIELTRDEDTCCRYGGDEFTVFLPDTSLYNAFLLAERIRRKVDKFELKRLNTELDPLTVQVSIGVSSLNKESPDKLIHEADRALLRAKCLSKNTTIVNCENQQKNINCDDCHLLDECAPNFNKQLEVS